MRIIGTIIHGTGKGKKRGFPTANIKLSKPYPFLREGIYCAWTELRGKKYKSAFAAQIKKGKIQVHLMDYSGEDFYGEEITTDLIQQISQMATFDNEIDLIAKITKDIHTARDCFQ